MNDNITQLLEKLATELGTTAEYLWAVLIAQAPISAMVSTIHIIIVILTGIFLFQLHRHFIKKEVYYETEELAVFPMLLGSILWGIYALVAIFSISNIITGFLNPEYWALKQILNLIN